MATRRLTYPVGLTCACSPFVSASRVNSRKQMLLTRRVHRVHTGCRRKMKAARWGIESERVLYAEKLEGATDVR